MMCNDLDTALSESSCSHTSDSRVKTIAAIPESRENTANNAVVLAFNSWIVTIIVCHKLVCKTFVCIRPLLTKVAYIVFTMLAWVMSACMMPCMCDASQEQGSMLPVCQEDPPPDIAGPAGLLGRGKL